MFLINPAGFPSSLYSTLLTLGLTTNLKLCLDAGDAESYSGSGQVWGDRSGGGYNFNLGSGSGSDGADPTFNGTAGHVSSSEYFSFDGGDWFTLGQANPSWVDALHKDNATFSFAAWTNRGIGFGDVGADGQGIVITATPSTLHPQLLVFTVSDLVLDASAAVLTLPVSGAWSFEAMSFNESTGALTFCVDGSFEALTGKTYASPGSTGATYTLQIGGQGNDAGAPPAGRNYANFAMWDRALSQAEMTALYNATKRRFGF